MSTATVQYGATTDTRFGTWNRVAATAYATVDLNVPQA